MGTLPEVQFDEYYLHHQLTSYLQAAAAAAPERVRLHNLHTTEQGLEEWLAEITDFATGSPEEKPAYLVHANVHAAEVSGTTAALVLIRKLLADPELAELLQRVVFYIIPRVNPDGAEYALSTGGQIRSKYEYRPRKNGLIGQDLNGDGLVLSMRWQDPLGAYRCDETDPRLLLRRKPGDSGPFYSMCREGMIEDCDGGLPQDAVRGHDFNRNWGYNWQPEYLQYGAGDYAFSNPEMRAVAEWVRTHPNIFGMLGFHNGCNAVLRPSATVADEELNPADLWALKELGELGERLTGFRLRAVREYKPDSAKPISLKGHFTDWGYFSLGLLVFEIELGCIYNAAGITTDEYFAADDNTREIEFARQIMKYADETGGSFVNWQPFEHPQLGPVEIGGFRSTVMACPPPQQLEAIGDRCADFIVAHARRHPRFSTHQVQVEAVGDDIVRLRLRLANTGELPTQVSEQGHRITANGPVTVRLLPGQGVELLSKTSLWEVESLAARTGHLDIEAFFRAAHSGAIVTVEARAPKAGVFRESVTLR